MDYSNSKSKTRSEDDLSSVNEQVNYRSDSFSIHSNEWEAVEQADILTRTNLRIRRLYNELILPNSGYSLLVFSQLLNSIMVLSCKLLVNSEVKGHKFQPLEILFVRQTITWLCCVVYLAIRREWNGFFGPKKLRKILLLRGVVGFAGVFSLYYTLQYLSISDAIAISFVTPMMTALLAWVILKESYSVLEAVCTVVSLGGVLLIAKPDFLFGSLADKEVSKDDAIESSSTTKRVLAVIVGMMGVGFSSAVYIILRKIGKQAEPITIVNVLSLCCSVISAIAIAVLPKMTLIMPENFYQWFLYSLIGFSGFFMQLTLTAGVQRVSAARSSLTSYLSIVFAIFWDLLIWHHLPNILSLLGISIIIFNAVLIVKLRPKGSSEDEENTIDTAAQKYEPIISDPIALEDLDDTR